MVYYLMELPAGIALFKVNGDKKKLKALHNYKNSADALTVTAQLVNGELAKPVSKFLKKAFVDTGIQDELAVMDSKLGKAIHEKLNIPCIHGDEVLGVFRSLRGNLEELITSISNERMGQAALGLSHTLNRYKLKFSADKVDMMVVQAVNLLEDLDKEINKYAMRIKEWYGWHFPELAKVIQDNMKFARIVLSMKTRFQAKDTDFSDFLDEEEAEKVIDAAMISMGTEIAEEDLDSIMELCTQVVDAHQYRIQLASYLSTRMQAIAPALTTMVGEIVGAKLIQKAGSLLSLAKLPASTVQILGAEKALFRALKQRQSTPKYGLLYNAQLITKASNQDKGKMSRVLAAKTVLSARIDSFANSLDLTTPVQEYRAQVEQKLKDLENGTAYNNTGKSRGAGRSFQQGQGGGYNQSGGNKGFQQDRYRGKQSRN